MLNIQNPIQKKVASVFVHVNDMERSVKWYSRLLGVPIRSGPYEKMYTIELENVYLLLDNHRGEPFTPAEQALFTFATDDIDKTLEYLISNEVQVIGEIERFTDISFITIKDLDGNKFIIVQE
jgi:Predicted enzyme related to lactoylglutathione lyase